MVLVPGAVGQDVLYWNVSQYFLERAGHPTYTLTFPRLSFGDHRMSARLLEEKVDEVLVSEDVDRVHVVSHSMGGLVTRYYARFLGGSEHLDHLVCLGTPHQGTYAAYAGLPLKGARMVRPGSPFLEALNDQGDGSTAVPITNIVSRFDSVVLPWDHALLQGENVTNRVHRFSNHWSLLVSPTVHGWVLGALNGSGDPGAGEAAASPAESAPPEPAEA